MKKILIIRFSSIGDIVLTSPVIRCIKAQVGDAEIHFITKNQYKPVLEANPHIDKLWLYDGNFDVIIPLLKKERFDFIIDLHRNIRSHYLKLRLGRPSGTFSKINFRKWLIVHFKINKLPQLHIVDRYFQAAGRLGVRNDGKGLDYFIPENGELDISSLLPGGETDFIAIAIGGKHTTKIFPKEMVAEVCNKIPRRIILVGGAEDAARGEWIVNNTGGNVISTCGKLSLNEAASVIRQASGVLTNDTGFMHVAAAFHKPIVSVWGNTIPAFGMYPYFPEGEKNTGYLAEVKDLYCRPCSKLGFNKCPRTHFRCMKDISTDEIASHL